MLETALKEFLDFRNGFFIEVGAHDGIFQSNTLSLEKDLGWTGILIEPSISAYLDCVKNRPNSKCINTALTSFLKYEKKKFAYGDFNSSPMSSIAGIRSGHSIIQNIKDYLKKKFYNQLVPASTIPMQLILEKLEINKIDFLSLDVEGFELEVLNGIDFTRYRPKYILIEVREVHKNNIFKFMEKSHYKLLKNISNFNKKDNPTWDGTHQDYLFLDKK